MDNVTEEIASEGTDKHRYRVVILQQPEKANAWMVIIAKQREQAN